jgi:hypothetical protein
LILGALALGATPAWAAASPQERPGTKPPPVATPPVLASACDLSADLATPPPRHPATKTEFDSLWVTAVEAVNQHEVWAAGIHETASAEGGENRPLLWHYGAGGWEAEQPEFLAQDVEIRDLAASSPTNVWAVGSRAPVPELFVQGDSMVARWDGTAWTAPDDVPGVSGASAVATLGADDVWVAGWAETPIQAVLEHWDGAAWAAFRVPGASTLHLFGLTALAPDDVWAVGSRTRETAGGTESRGRVLHWDGVRWSVVPVPRPLLGGGSSDLYTVAAAAPDDVWALGTRLNHQYRYRPLALHWDGTTWSAAPMPDGLDMPESADVGPDGSVWVAGVIGMARWDGITWSMVERADSDSAWSGLSVDRAGRVWVVGSSQWGYSTVPLALRVCGT